MVSCFQAINRLFSSVVLQLKAREASGLSIELGERADVRLNELVGTGALRLLNVTHALTRGFPARNTRKM